MPTCSTPPRCPGPSASCSALSSRMLLREAREAPLDIDRREDEGARADTALDVRSQSGRPAPAECTAGWCVSSPRPRLPRLYRSTECSPPRCSPPSPLEFRLTEVPRALEACRERTRKGTFVGLSLCSPASSTIGVDHMSTLPGVPPCLDCL